MCCENKTLITPATQLNGSSGRLIAVGMNGTDDEAPFQVLFNVLPFFWQTVPFFIFLFGSFGNIMTIVICRHAGVMSSMSVYFITLACSDLMSLTTNDVNQWVYYTFDIDVTTLHPVLCKMIGWLMYVSGVLSAWVLVAMTAQRAVCVLWPHRADILCSARNSKAITFSMTLFIAVLNCHLLYGLDFAVISHDTYKTSTIGVTSESTHSTSKSVITFRGDTHSPTDTVVTLSGGKHTAASFDVTSSNVTHTTIDNTGVIFSGNTHTSKKSAVNFNRYSVCVVGREYLEFYFSVWGLVDLLIFSVLPWLCLVVSNSVLLWTLNVSIRQAQHSLGSAHTDGFSDRKKQASSMTVTLFAVSTVFIVLNLPMSCIQVLAFHHYNIGSLNYLYQSEVIAYCYDIAMALWEANSAVNFYIYCLTGSKFRIELKKVFSFSVTGKTPRATTLSSTGGITFR